MPRPLFKRAAIRWALKYPPPKKHTMLEDDPPDPYHFFIYLRDRAGDRKYIVQGMDAEGLSGLWFENTSAKGEARKVSNIELRDYRVEFLHFFPGYSVRYDGTGTFFWALTTLYPWRHAIWDRIAQKFFNRRPLVRFNRIAVLRFFIDRTLKKADFKVTEISLLSLMFSNRYVAHPEHEETERYYTMIMDSLVETGELDKDQAYYFLKAKAFSTVHQHEESEQRHSDMVRQQTVLASLTAALVFVGLLQAYITWNSNSNDRDWTSPPAAATGIHSTDEQRVR